MSTAYHFSPTLNEPRPCSNPANCKFGSDTKHYDSPEQYYAEEAAEAGMGTTNTVSRTEAPEDTEQGFSSWNEEVSATVVGSALGKHSGTPLYSTRTETDDEGNDITVITVNNASVSLPEDGVVRSGEDIRIPTEPDASAGEVRVSKSGKSFKAVYVSADGETEDLGGSRTAEALLSKVNKKLNPRGAAHKRLDVEDEKHARAQKLLSSRFAQNDAVDEYVSEVNAEAGKPGETSTAELQEIVQQNQQRGTAISSEYNGFLERAAIHKAAADAPSKTQSAIEHINDRYQEQAIGRAERDQMIASVKELYGNQAEPVSTTVAADKLSYSSTFRVGDRELTENYSGELSAVENGTHSLLRLSPKYANNPSKALPEEVASAKIPVKEAEFKQSYTLTDKQGIVVSTDPRVNAHFFAREKDLYAPAVALRTQDPQLADEAMGFISEQNNNGLWNSGKTTGGDSVSDSGADTDAITKRLADYTAVEKDGYQPAPGGWEATSEAANEDRHIHNAYVSARARAREKARELISRINQHSSR